MNGLSFFEETQTKILYKGYEKYDVYLKTNGSDIVALHINIGGNWKYPSILTPLNTYVVYLQWRIPVSFSV